MLPLLGDDGADSRNGAWIVILERGDLLLQMAEHDAFDSNAGRCNGAATEQTGSQAKYITTEATQPVTTAAWLIPTSQFRSKDAQVSLLVQTELAKFIDHIRSGNPREKDLARIDVDCPAFAGVVDLDDAIA